MLNAEPESTTSSSSELEDNNGHASLVAVSEENLAALMRAMIGSSEPEAPRPAEHGNTAPAIDAKESSAEACPPRADSPAALAGPPANVVESRLALFAAVKENRAAISRSVATPAASPAIDQSRVAKSKPATDSAKQAENLAVNPPLKATPPVTLPETVPAKPASVATPSPAKPLYVTPPSAKPTSAIPSPIATSHDPSHETPRPRLIIGLAIGALIAIVVGVSIFLTRAHSSTAPTPVASAPKDNAPQQVQAQPPVQARVESPLQVRVEPLGKGLIEVRWNPQSAALAQARVGRLVITEHNQKPRVLSLESGQLKTGHLTYQSASDSIQFDLEIVDRSGAAVKESVLALQSPTSSQQLTATPPQAQNGQAATAKPQDTPNPGATAQVPQPSQPTLRTFVAPTPQRNSEQRVIADAPALITNGPVTVPGVGLTALPAVISPPPPSKAAPQAGQQAAPQQVRVESSVQAANLVKKVVPTYPQIARSTGIQGVVRFTAHIGKDGRILNLKFLNGPPVLVDSAAAAVKQWVYRPTLLNGEPVEVITQIDVNFTLHQSAR